MILEVANLSCAVPGRVLFEGLSFEVDCGQSLAIMGPSGSGKSTIISAILGMTQVRKGLITVCGRRISNTKAEESARIRREHIGVVFQNGELLPELTAAENIAVALIMNQVDSRERLVNRAIGLLEQVDVPPQTKAGDLSGGERQRTALVRALVTEPELVIADEPTGSLDTITRDTVADLLFSTAKNRESALLIVTHDPTVASRADMTLNLGQLTLDNQH